MGNSLVAVQPSFLSRAQEAALRAWYSGLSSRNAIEQYLPELAVGSSARGAISQIRKILIAFAKTCQRQDLAVVLDHPESQRAKLSDRAIHAIDSLRNAVPMKPQITDDVGQWFSARITKVLREFDVKTLADLTVRIPRRKMWWVKIDGLGKVLAKQIEQFFSDHPELTSQARAIVLRHQVEPAMTPWESFVVPFELSGTHGTYRAPLKICSMDARTDRDAVSAWLQLLESPATVRSYRKEVERLMLWAVLVRNKALSSLSVEDAIAYRAFLKSPHPRAQWVGSPASRSSSNWRPFTGPLAPKSITYSLSVLNAMYRWLIAQGYSLVNPFAGVKVRNAKDIKPIGVDNCFTTGEWGLLRAIAGGLEWSHGWSKSAAARLRFCLDFAYGTGLRLSEMTNAQLGNIQKDGHDDYWIYVIGKGGKRAKVSLPPFVRASLDQYLIHRGISITAHGQDPGAHLVGSDAQRLAGISPTRLWNIYRRFFDLAAKEISGDHPVLSEKLRRATPHWLRHTHASHALANGVDLTTVRDNLRHASVATTSLYLHTDDVLRAQQIAKAFG